jgi:hypothetical protein
MTAAELLAQASDMAMLDVQRARRFAEAEEAAQQGAERVRVHPAGHFGPCPASSGGWISRGEMAHGSAAVWHLDADQPRPSWWSRLPMVVAPPTPAELSAQRARREIELKAAEEAERVSSRNVR